MKKKNKTPTYNLTWAQIEQIKKDAKAEAAAEAVERALVIPLLVLRDHWGFGPARMERFIKQVAEVADDIGDGRISLDDITGALEEEIGLEFTWREK